MRATVVNRVAGVGICSCIGTHIGGAAWDRFLTTRGVQGRSSPSCARWAVLADWSAAEGADRLPGVCGRGVENHSEAHLGVVERAPARVTTAGLTALSVGPTAENASPAVRPVRGH